MTDAPERIGHLELFYTSAPRGIRRGTSGFCTVALSADMPEALAARLELLSSYSPIYPAGSAAAARNPTVHAHWRIPIGMKPRSVLSALRFAGLDHTRRANKFAHHIVLDPAQLPIAGPAWAMLQPGVMAREWTGEPRLLPPGKQIPQGDHLTARCAAWQRAASDAGWAGALAESFLLDPTKVSYIIYEPELDPLPLIDEAIALLPPRLRWQVTFSTYFTELPAGLTCAWRCVVANTTAARDAARHATSGLVIDLSRPLGRAPDSLAANRARAGQPLVEQDAAHGEGFALTVAAAAAGGAFDRVEEVDHV